MAASPSTPPSPSQPVARLLRSLLLPAVLVVILGWMDQGLRERLFPAGAASPTEVWYDRLLVSSAILLGAFVVYKAVTFYFLDRLLARSLGRPVPRIVKDMLAVALFGCAILVGTFLLFNEVVSALLTLSGIFGIVVGLALRPIILDVFSGLSANIDAAFHIGDYVQINGSGEGIAGWVQQVNWRTTHIRTRSGNLVICPNSVISTSVVTNLSRPEPLSRFGVKVRLPPEIPTHRGLAILENAVHDAAGRPQGPSAERRPEVVITDLADSGIEYWIRFWLDPARESPDAVTSAVLASTMRHLHFAGFRLAREREQVVLERGPALPADQGSVEGRLRALRTVGLFQGVDTVAMETLARSMHHRCHSAGSAIFRQGDTSEELVLLVEGNARVIVTREGRELEVARLRPGDYFGEMALLTGEPRSATIRCDEDCAVFEIDRAIVRDLLAHHPELLEVLSANLAKRRAETEASIARQGEAKALDTGGLAAAFLRKMRALFGAGGS